MFLSVILILLLTKHQLTWTLALFKTLLFKVVQVSLCIKTHNHMVKKKKDQNQEQPWDITTANSLQGHSPLQPGIKWGDGGEGGNPRIYLFR